MRMRSLAHRRHLSPLSLLVQSFGIEELISTFPLTHSMGGLAGQPIGLQEYFASYPNGDLILLVLPTSNVYHNILNTRDLKSTMLIKDELGQVQQAGPVWAANRKRLSLFGSLELLNRTSEIEEAKKKKKKKVNR